MRALFWYTDTMDVDMSIVSITRLCHRQVSLISVLVALNSSRISQLESFEGPLSKVASFVSGNAHFYMCIQLHMHQRTAWYCLNFLIFCSFMRGQLLIVYNSLYL